MEEFLDVHGNSELLLREVLTGEQLMVNAVLLWDANEDSGQRRLLVISSKHVCHARVIGLYLEIAIGSVKDF